MDIDITAMILSSGSGARYDKYYQTPRVWLTGYDEVGKQSFSCLGYFLSVRREHQV